MIFRSLPILKRYGPWALGSFVSLFLINMMEVLFYKLYSFTPFFVTISLFFMISLLIRSSLLTQEPFIKFLYLMGASYKQVAAYFHKEIVYLASVGTVIGLTIATPFIVWKIYEFRIFFISLFVLLILIFCLVIFSKFIILYRLNKLYN
jgi:hypothetical protein